MIDYLHPVLVRSTTNNSCHSAKSNERMIRFVDYLIDAMLDLEKLKKGTLFTLKIRASSKLVKHYNYKIIIVGGR
jgi:hypothetical protein